jgi:hypothetical protein
MYTVDTQASICIYGNNVMLQELPGKGHRTLDTVDRPVKWVSTTSFTIRRFLGLNIAVISAQDANITDNTVIDGALYSVLTVSSKRILIECNTVNSSPLTLTNNLMPFIGVYMDDVHKATTTRNVISGYLIGLCVQSVGANIYGNKGSNCCIGTFVNSGIVGAKLRDSVVKDTNPRYLDSRIFSCIRHFYRR